jgi:acyl carrier protein
MTYEETLEVTKKLLRRHVPEEKAIEPTHHIQNDLELDSIGIMELVADVEEKFEVTIPNEMMDEMVTVADVARCLVKLKEAGVGRQEA